MTKIPHYPTMTITQMFVAYNEEAVRRGVAKMRRADRPTDRGDMGKALALLLAQPRAKAPPAPANAKTAVARPQDEVRTVAVEELCRVSHFEHIASGRRVEVADAAKLNPNALRSYGFAYSLVLTKVRKRIPTSAITGAKLRSYVTHIRSGRAGYEGGELPDRRQHSNKGRRPS